MRKFLLLLILCSPVFFSSCGGDNKDEPEKKETMLDFNLNDLNSYYGEWVISGEIQDNGEIKERDPYVGDKTYEITADGKFIRHQRVYSFPADYTFENGVFTCTASDNTATYKFSHYDETRLQVKAIRHSSVGTTMHIYVVWKYPY